MSYRELSNKKLYAQSNSRRMKLIFLSVSFFRKLIVHENLYLKLFCSSKIVDFRALFAKFSAPQAYFTWVVPHIWNLAPPILERYLRACHWGLQHPKKSIINLKALNNCSLENSSLSLVGSYLIPLGVTTPKKSPSST